MKNSFTLSVFSFQWQENGFFDKGVFVRKLGTNEFLDGKRIDFDLYI